MSLIASLDIALRGDTSNLDKALTKSEGAVQRFTVNIKAAGDKGGEGLGGAAGKAGLIAGVMGVVATKAIEAGSSVGKFILDSIQGVDQLARTAATLGTTTGALAGLQHGAAVAGVDMETMDHSLEKFQKHISEGGQGNAEVIASFNKLGISMEDIKDIPLEKQMGVVGDALKKTGNDADQLQITLALFGKSAAPLKEMLKGGSEGMADMQKEAEKLGLAVSGEQAAQVQEATKGWREFMEAIKGIGRSLAVVFAPVLTKITDAIKSFAGAGATGLSSNIKFWQTLVSVAFDVGKSIFEIIYTLNGVIPLFKLVSGSISENSISWEDWKQLILKAAFNTQFYLSNWQDAFSLLFQKAKLVAVGFGNDIMHLFTNGIPNSLAALMRALGTFGDAWSAAWKKLKSGDVAGAFSGMKDAFVKAMKDIGGGIAADLVRPETELEKKMAAEIAQKEKAFNNDLDAFVKQKFADFNKAAIKDKQPAKGENQLGGNFAKPASMEAGSKEAFSVLYGTQTAQEKALAVANDQLNEDKKMTKLLQKIAQQRFGLKVAKI